MDRHPQNDWETIRYDARYDVHWIRAGGSKQQLFFCPYCGERLPPSQRDRWFDALEALGIDPNVHDVPEPFQSGAWRGAPPPPPPAPRFHGEIEGRYVDLHDPPPGVPDAYGEW